MDYPYDLGSYSRKITTKSADAQLWFDRGLNWCFGYHHQEAGVCFAKALEFDPDCAMAYWGISYASGPNYNLPWEFLDPAGKAHFLGIAYDAARAALARKDSVTAPERALIEALAARYPQRDAIEDQRPWNDAFADAMRAVHLAHPNDLDLRVIFVEAIMNRTPWRMWNPRTGEPEPGAGTLEAREALETAFRELAGAKEHPGLLHLYVHLMEMSPHPEVALMAGDRLRDLTQDMGHLTHMPTHIDILCGYYRDAMYWNQRASVADRKYYDRAGPMNFYSAYRAHNYHFTAYAAMFLGQYGPAIAAADALIATIPEALLRVPSPPMADFFGKLSLHPPACSHPLRQMARDPGAGLPGGPRTLLQHHRDDALRQGRRPCRAGRGGRGGSGTNPLPRRRPQRAEIAQPARHSLHPVAGGGRGDAGRRDRLSPG